MNSVITFLPQLLTDELVSDWGNELQIFLLSDISTGVLPDSNRLLCSTSTSLQRRLLAVKSFPAGKEKWVPQRQRWQSFRVAKHPLLPEKHGKRVFPVLIYKNSRKILCKSALKIEDPM